MKLFTYDLYFMNEVYNHQCKAGIEVNTSTYKLKSGEKDVDISVAKSMTTYTGSWRAMEGVLSFPHSCYTLAPMPAGKEDKDALVLFRLWQMSPEVGKPWLQVHMGSRFLKKGRESKSYPCDYTIVHMHPGESSVVSWKNDTRVIGVKWTGTALELDGIDLKTAALDKAASILSDSAQVCELTDTTVEQGLHLMEDLKKRVVSGNDLKAQLEFSQTCRKLAQAWHKGADAKSATQLLKMALGAVYANPGEVSQPIKEERALVMKMLKDFKDEKK